MSAFNLDLVADLPKVTFHLGQEEGDRFIAFLAGDRFTTFLAECEASRGDAARYRWLRARDLETLNQGGVFAGLTPMNVVLNGADLDQAIDAAIAAEKEKS